MQKETVVAYFGVSNIPKFTRRDLRFQT